MTMTRVTEMVEGDESQSKRRAQVKRKSVHPGCAAGWDVSAEARNGGVAAVVVVVVVVVVVLVEYEV
ncbi:hypothetical protein O3P69_018708 [Scylla paramamosain]|uniref:Uncharacterized protein n=1 Tax=Scylla paramamosain TaxID=85552 RepID=A0AAW0ST81_SCYPA